ncbi:hypothetical protein TWF694_010091 [Orbilia ellipsospora]|uniref:RING-type domain-containing protein n=1 Tax=Orbilia ellipsospora TaxID=2528407 RepID=A0AAV9X8U4_9PEZI
MDLPSAGPASQAAQQFLPPSTSTLVGHSNRNLAGPITHPGPSSQTSAPRPSLSVQAGGPSLATEKCAHKDTTRCSLHQGDCCSCADDRAHEQYYERYADGIGVVIDAPRWAHYCTFCKDYWDRLNSRIPPYRDNQPRITAWDLFQLGTPPNVPPTPNLTLSESARHSLTPSAQAAILAVEDGFPQSYAIFRLLSPNFSNEYHPVVAEHIRTWGELESRIADEPRYTPEFNTLLAQYHNARYKAKRMTELDRQSRGGGLSVQATDEYFQLLSTPGPFDVPGTSTGSSSSGSGSSGTNGVSSSSGASISEPPNFGHLGTSFARVSSLGNFLQSSFAQASSSAGNGHGNASSGQTAPTGENRSSLPGTSQDSSTITSPPPRISPRRPNRRRGSTPFHDSIVHRTNPPTEPGNRSSIIADRERERERDRDRETGRITAADRRRQLRERNETEWENQRPLSASSPANTHTNRTSIDSTIVDAIMSDIPSSQNSDNLNGFSTNPNETSGPNDNGTPSNNPMRRFIQTYPTSEPWNVAQFPSGPSRSQSNDNPPAGPSRREGPNNVSANNAHALMAGSPITPPFVFPNRRSLRPNSLDQTTNPSTNVPPSDPSTRNASVTSPSHRLSAPANFLPSLPHLPVPRFSPPRTLNRPRGASISNNNTSNHNRQNSGGNDGFANGGSTRRRERTNPLAQALGTRADVEREDYESPIRTMFQQGYEEYRQAEEMRRRRREMEVEHREFLQNQEGSNPEVHSRRLQEHRNRQYEYLHRANLQRQIDQLHAQTQTGNTSSVGIGPLSNSMYLQPNWPAHHPHHHHSPTNPNNRSPEDNSGLGTFAVSPEDEHSSNSDDYEDFNPLDPPLGDDESFFTTLVDGYLSRFPPAIDNPTSHRRASRLRRHFNMNSDDHPALPGAPPSTNRTSDELRDRFPTRIDRNRRLRERDEILRSRHNETIRDIASLVTGARDAGVMGFPHRWSRDAGSGSGSSRNNHNSQHPRTLDHPERPDNMKEEDLKIMADCKVCYGQIADIVLLPCAHLVLCQWCADTVAPAAPGRAEGVVAPRSNCPVCRTRVEKKIKVFRC